MDSPIDNDGRAYAKVSEVKEGSRVQIDGDFTCMRPWSQHMVYNIGERLYIPCKDGEHFLEGQLSDDGEHYVGLYLVAPIV